MYYTNVFAYVLGRMHSIDVGLLNAQNQYQYNFMHIYEKHIWYIVYGSWPSNRLHNFIINRIHNFERNHRLGSRLRLHGIGRNNRLHYSRLRRIGIGTEESWFQYFIIVTLESYIDDDDRETKICSCISCHHQYYNLPVLAKLTCIRLNHRL